MIFMAITFMAIILFCYENLLLLSMQLLPHAILWLCSSDNYIFLKTNFPRFN